MYSQLVKIQSGSFSTVYRAYDTERARDVALKILKKPSEPAMASKLATLVGSELEVLRVLGTGHPNVCALLDFYERETCYVFVMEYAARGDLYDVIRGWKRHSAERVPVELARVVLQLCSAIEYAHSCGIAHRDIKPENVLLDSAGNVKLADWGLSTRMRVSCDTRIGTEKYLAPEAYASPHDTFLADFWSLGVTLLFVMFGACPFKNACLTKSPNNPNFAHFVASPHRFISEYYFLPLRAARSAKPAEWLSLPHVSDALQREQLLQLCATCAVTTLLVVNPQARSMQKFLLRVNELLPSSNALGLDPSPDACDDLYTDFFYSGLVTNPKAVASIYADKSTPEFTSGSITSGSIASGGINIGSTTSGSVTSSDSTTSSVTSGSIKSSGSTTGSTNSGSSSSLSTASSNSSTTRVTK